MREPGLGLTTGAQPRTAFAPQRFIAPDDIAWPRRRAVWALYRYAGVLLTELVWSPEHGLPRVETDNSTRWTLYVQGKGQKPRAIPLPAVCVGALRAYRLAWGLPSEPSVQEQVPLIHGTKGGSLQETGLYREVKAIFDAVTRHLDASDPDRALLLRTTSPHWLRHAYARTLVVEHRTPLPVAQALLGHASVQTTAAYAKTDLSQLREFVDASFTADGQ